MKQEIYEFATRWLREFGDPEASPYDLLEGEFSDDCRELGFRMDCGRAFADKYGNADRDAEALRRVIGEMDDLLLLGSAAYSRWRYFKHWAYSSGEILELENRDWFLLALNRMAQLAGVEADKQIARISVTYRCVVRTEGTLQLNGPISIETDENLILDRDTETVEIVRNLGTGCSLTNRIHVEGGVGALLDGMDPDVLFGVAAGDPDDVLQDPNCIRRYETTVALCDGTEKYFSGDFDRRSLPIGWAEFARKVREFVEFYLMSELLDPSVYGKAKRCASDYIYCRVMFYGNYTKYYYRTEDASICLGDRVVVPFGKDNFELEGDVVDIGYYQADEVPFPLEKTKSILRKAERRGLA